MNATVKAIITGAVAIASIASVAAVIMVIVAHGGVNSGSLTALGILVAMIGTSVPPIVNLVKSQQIDTKVSNGLIPEKVSQALALPEVQAAIRTVVEDVFTTHTNAVVQSPTVDIQPTNQPKE